MTIQLSNRQYVMLKMLHRFPASLDYMLKLNQRTAGSLLDRGLITYSPRDKGFIVSTFGHVANGMFQDTDEVKRKNQKAPLARRIRNAFDRNRVTQGNRTSRNRVVSIEKGSGRSRAASTGGSAA